VGTAVPRGTKPPAHGGVVIPPGYYGGYYYPWWLGVGYGAAYAGGYYGGYYDPWYGGDPDGAGCGGGGQSSYSSDEEGSLHLKVKPREAEVYVDGYYVGLVDDFDGIFQKLHIISGPHHVEVRAAGYEPLVFDVRITAGQGTTYQGELKRIQ
jgi:hypothetical protein